MDRLEESEGESDVESEDEMMDYENDFGHVASTGSGAQASGTSKNSSTSVSSATKKEVKWKPPKKSKKKKGGHLDKRKNKR